MVHRHVTNALVTLSDAEGSLVSCNQMCLGSLGSCDNGSNPCSLTSYGRTWPEVNEWEQVRIGRF